MRLGFTTFGQLLRAVMVAVVTLSSAGASLHAQEKVAISITVQGHQFRPAEIRAPANTQLEIKVKNLDSAAMEFESVSLRVEKVIAPGSEGVVHVRALAPGRYEFFDDFHQQTRGALVVQ